MSDVIFMQLLQLFLRPYQRERETVNAGGLAIGFARSEDVHLKGAGRRCSEGKSLRRLVMFHLQSGFM
jgi:hypothetical protein